ncbi:MAG: hypothetical protein HZC25_17510 [Rhodospirillales bacterium]|nr:hypothetical protein [Rhodospirillales bacterium]
MSGWGCPHESQGSCDKVGGRACEPGMKGCILRGRFRFADDSKNRPRKSPPSAASSPADQDDPDKKAK